MADFALHDTPHYQRPVTIPRGTKAVSTLGGPFSRLRCSLAVGYVMAVVSFVLLGLRYISYY